jgi:molybdenum cofactor cytidylyltransferase
MRTAQIVLAAGRSRRMGRPKALLDFDGKTALRLVVEAAAGAGVERSVIVAGPGATARGLGVEDVPLAIRWVTNPDPESEQAASLKLALEDLAAPGKECGERIDAFFFQPVDFPLVTARDYRLLLEALAADRGATPVFYLSAAGRRGHPVLCRVALAAELCALGPDGSARDVLARQPAAHVLTENLGVIDDMDTPEDYERLLAAYRGRSV